MRRALFPTLLAFALLIAFADSAEAIGRSGKKRIRLKIAGACDQYFNNLKTGPEMIGAVPDGTTCTAEVTLWKKTAAGRVPLRNKEIHIGSTSERNALISPVADGTTNNRGKASIDFNWSTSACFYNAFVGAPDGPSVPSEEVIIDPDIQFPEACQGNV